MIQLLVKIIWSRQKACRWPTMAAGVIVGLALWATNSVAAVMDVVGHLPVDEFDDFISPQTYKDWGSEPFIAVNPVDSNKIAISSFGYGHPTHRSFPDSDDGASLWYSTDGGANWGIRFPITAAPDDRNVPWDQVFAYDGDGTLHGAIVARATGSTDGYVYHGSTADPDKDGVNGRPASVWTWTDTAINQDISTNADQPWIAVGGGQVFVAYDNYTSGSKTEERVARSDDGGVSFTVDDPVSSGGRLKTSTNPGLRIAIDDNGNAYAVFGIGGDCGFCAGDRHVNYRLNRYSGGADWDYTTENPDPGGLIVDDGDTSLLTFPFGGKNALLGNITAIASAPTGLNVYVVYGKQDDNEVDRLFLAEFHPDAGGELVERADPVAFSVDDQAAALPSVTVTDNGTVFVLYYTSPADDEFEVHLAESTDLGLTFSDSVLYTFDTEGMTPGGSAFPHRILGDYIFMTSLGNTAYGTFAGRGNVDTVDIDTTAMIVPFFFMTSAAVPEPYTAILLGMGGSMIYLRRRRQPQRFY